MRCMCKLADDDDWLTCLIDRFDWDINNSALYQLMYPCLTLTIIHTCILIVLVLRGCAVHSCAHRYFMYINTRRHGGTMNDTSRALRAAKFALGG